jgi:hypothetical protein
MSPTDWTGVAVAAVTVIGSFFGSVRWLVKHYLLELKPNSGSSMRDEFNARISSLEARVETVIRILER